MSALSNVSSERPSSSGAAPNLNPSKTFSLSTAGSSQSGQSKQLSPAEYSLQHIFSDFIRHAELKLNLVLTTSPALSSLPSFAIPSAGAGASGAGVSGIGGAGMGEYFMADFAYLHAMERGFTSSSSSLLVTGSNSSSGGPGSNTHVSSAASQHSNNVLVRYLSSGADWQFDQLIAALSNIAKYKVRAVMDALVIWRKMKSDPVDLALIRQLVGDDATEMKLKDTQAVLKERKMLAANYILCRVLIEIVRRIRTGEALTEDLGVKLEEMVYSQLKSADPESLLVSPNRLLNLDIFAELLGALSNLRFKSVTERFLNELTQVMTSGTGAAAQVDAKVDLLIRSMRFLKLRVYPQDCLDQTVQFLGILARQFNDAQSTTIRHAYTQVLTELLLPIGAVATAEVNIPEWMTSVELIYAKAVKMASKPRHTLVVLPLVATLMSVSRKDTFLTKLNPVLDMLYQRFKDKDKLSKSLMLVCISRLIC